MSHGIGFLLNFFGVICWIFFVQEIVGAIINPGQTIPRQTLDITNARHNKR